MIGKTISHYKILEKIGEGGMGVVYKAEDTKLRRIVALKFLPPELMRDQEAKERFIQEAQAAAALNHPNICTVYEIDEVDGRNFIAMEYIKGHSLKEKIASGPIQIDDSLEIVHQIAEGLLEAHENGIIHRDIKPANIMVTKRGQVKIMDFGLAKLEWGVDLTKTATIMGTVAYMSPEQAQGEKVDHRTDIWALGAVLYEMLSGIRPFKSPHDQAALYAILNEEPEPLSHLRKEVPDELEKIVSKALTKTPAQRLRSMGEFLRKLKRISSASIPADEEQKSIAVLPFENMSPDPEQEFFCDGITEEIINALTHLENLRVIARTSAFAFKAKHEDIREIGRKLDVETLLEGSVRKSGDRLRITAQLINVSDGSHLWSERFDRRLEDVFDIQDEISATIAENLKIKLSPADEPRAKARHSSNIEAYDAYLKGVFYQNKMTEMWVKKAITSFEKAISLDPDYALAYTGLAEAHLWFSLIGDLTSKEFVSKIKEYIEKALELDPDLAEAHMMKGTMAFYHDWDRETATSELEKALELNPNSTKTLARYAIYLMCYEGKYEEVLSLVDRAVALDPLDLHVKTYYVWVNCFLRKLDEALKQAQKILELEPNYPYAHYWIGIVYGYKGEYEKAIEKLEEALRLGGRTFNNLGVLGYYYGKAGRKENAKELAAELEDRARQGQGSASWLARIYLGLGEIDKVFEWLEWAYNEHNLFLFYIYKDPPYAEVRSDPRFINLMRKMGLDLVEDEPTRSILPVSEKAELKPDHPKEDVLESSEAKPSIAVLPFVDMSPQKDEEYFCDGIAEELINALTKIKNINVVARTSAFAFKGKTIDVREIGRMLNVEKVLEGSVRKAGNKIRITAQLINVSDGYHLWSEKFDRDMEDIFAIQDEISLAIVDNLKISLLKMEKEALLKRYTEDIEAYNLYLKGIFFLRMYTAEGFQEAIKYFERTLQRDPNYALAYYGLAEVFYAISFWANVPPHEAYPKAKEYANKAIEIDDEVGEAHAALGLVYTFYDWDWEKAERELKRALEFNPSSAIIHMSYSWFLSLTERHEKAIFEAKRAQELDPLSPLIISHIGLACIYGSQFDKAVDELKEGIGLAPDFYLMHYYLGLAYRAKSMVTEAIAEMEKAVELSGGAPWPALILTTCYFEEEQTNNGEKLLQSLEQRAEREYLPPMGFSYIYFVRNDLDKAYYWLERACEEKDSFLPWCAIIPFEDWQLFNEPRLRPLFKKYGLIE